jgi:hypothetical protein
MSHWRCPGCSSKAGDECVLAGHSKNRVASRLARFKWPTKLAGYTNSSITISGFDPRRRGGPQVPAPLEVKTCIFPMRLRP